MADAEFKKPNMAVLKAFIGFHVFVYRLTGGAVMGKFGQGPVVLLTVRGRKSGKPITTPLIYIPTDRGQAVIGSFAGSPTDPAWLLNLRAAGEAEVQVGGKRWRVRPDELPVDSDRHRQLWNEAVAIYPGYADYRKKTTRPMPIIELIKA